MHRQYFQRRSGLSLRHFSTIWDAADVPNCMAQTNPFVVIVRNMYIKLSNKSRSQSKFCIVNWIKCIYQPNPKLPGPCRSTGAKMATTAFYGCRGGEGTGATMNYFTEADLRTAMSGCTTQHQIRQWRPPLFSLPPWAHSAPPPTQFHYPHPFPPSQMSTTLVAVKLTARWWNGRSSWCQDQQPTGEVQHWE